LVLFWLSCLGSSVLFWLFMFSQRA
jgi:hypothetical protein